MSVRDGRVVFIPIDDSISCKKAFQWYIAREHIANDSVVFFTVIDPKKQRNLYLDTDNVDVETCKAIAQKVAAGFRDVCRERKISYVTRMTVSSNIGHAILEQVVKCNANVIVMSNETRVQKSETLFGGARRHVIMNSPVPIILIPVPHKRLSIIP